MDKKEILSLIEMFEQARYKPAALLGGTEAHLLNVYLSGFDAAIGPVFHWEQQRRREAIATEKGLNLISSGTITFALKQKGLSDEAVIDELLQIEIEVWQRRLEELENE